MYRSTLEIRPEGFAQYYLQDFISPPLCFTFIACCLVKIGVPILGNETEVVFELEKAASGQIVGSPSCEDRKYKRENMRTGMPYSVQLLLLQYSERKTMAVEPFYYL